MNKPEAATIITKQKIIPSHHQQKGNGVFPVTTARIVLMAPTTQTKTALTSRLL